MHANALVVMAKAPIPGQSKTRLVPPLSPKEAAELSRCLLLDLLANLKSFKAADRFVAFLPIEAASFFEDAVPYGFRCFPQRGRDLGERMKNVFDDLMKEGYKNVVLVGSDVPALPLRFLEEAFSALKESEEVVLGPSRDGGYYLIGMKQRVPEIFKEIAWSSSNVLAATTEKLGHLGIAPRLLPPWFDIDTFKDLRHLQSVPGTNLNGIQERTNRFLKTLALKKTSALAI